MQPVHPSRTFWSPNILRSHYYRFTITQIYWVSLIWPNIIPSRSKNVVILMPFGTPLFIGALCFYTTANDGSHFPFEKCLVSRRARETRETCCRFTLKISRPFRKCLVSRRVRECRSKF